MYETVNKTDFVDRFKAIRPGNFSYEGLSALFDFLEELERDIGEDMEFDPIAICCDFGEYAEDEIRQEFDHVDGITEAEDLDEMAEILNEETIVIEAGDTLILAAF